MFPLYNFDYLMQNLYVNPVTSPYLLIYSTSKYDEIPIAKKMIKEFKKLGNMKFHFVDGGHDVHLLQPEIVAPIISTFLLSYGAKL